jgi:DNA-binding NarL/FixJ family response regulator
MTPQIRVAILDDDVLFAEALALLLGLEPALDLLFYNCSGTELIRSIEERSTPDILLCDLKLQGESGLDLVTALSGTHPDMRVIALSAFYKPVYVAAALRNGFSAFLPKNCTPEELLRAISAVHTTGVYYRQRDLALVQDFLRNPKGRTPGFELVSGLSRREEEIVGLICLQYTNLEIAEKLFLSIRTVEGHRNRILEKTGIRNSAGLVVFALVRGIVNLDDLSLRDSLGD